MNLDCGFLPEDPGRNRSPLIPAMLFAALCAPGPQEGQTVPPPRAPDAALFETLIAKTDGLRSFAAEYRVRSAAASQAGVVRILYQAPDRAKIDFAGQTVLRIQDGFVDLRSSAKGAQPTTVHVELARPIRERFERLANAMREEFPGCSGAWRAGGEGGVHFDMQIGTAQGSAEKSVSVSAAYACPREALLGWLEVLRKREGGRREEGEKLVYEDPDGTKLALSTRTGFVQSVERQGKEGLSSFVLASLDLDPQLGAEDFELPAPAAGAIDGSAGFAERVQELQTGSHREQVFAEVARLVAEKKIEWDEGARGRARKVLEVLHGDGLTAEVGSWTQKTRASIAKYGEEVRTRVAGLEEGDGEGRRKIEEGIRGWRETLAKVLSIGLQARIESLAIDAGVVGDAKLRESLLEIDRAALKAAFESGIEQPLLRELDERIELARQGK